MIVLLFKIIAGLALVFAKDKKTRKYAAYSLVAFTLAATIIYHNPFEDPSQLNTALRNLAIAGGLLLVN